MTPFQAMRLRNAGLAAPTDPNFANVSLLLPLHDANGSSTITDYSGTPKTMTRNGTGGASNTVTKFGNNSYHQSNVSDYLGTPDNAAFDFGSGDWSIEFFVNLASISVTQNLILKAVGTGAYPYTLIFWQPTGKFRFLGFNNATSLVINIASTTSPAANTDYFIQAIRSGTTFSLNINGAQESSVNPGATTMLVNAGKFIVGGDDGSGSAPLTGYINNLRVTKGVARTVAVPTAQWPES